MKHPQITQISFSSWSHERTEGQLCNREWTRIDTNNYVSFAFIRVHSRLILLAHGFGAAALRNLRISNFGFCIQ
jgi:hypothetical protein